LAFTYIPAAASREPSDTAKAPIERMVLSGCSPRLLSMVMNPTKIPTAPTPIMLLASFDCMDRPFSAEKREGLPIREFNDFAGNLATTYISAK
jgi:hypothetical protein